MVDEAALLGRRTMGVSVARSVAALLVLVAVGLAGSPRGAVRRRLGVGGRSGPGPQAGLAALGRRLGGDALEPEDETLAGVAALAVVGAGFALGPSGALAALLAAVGAVAARRRARRREQEMAIERALPEVIDLLSLLVGAGRPAALALVDIGPRVPEPFRSELAGVVRRTAAGESFAESTRRLHKRLGPSVAAVVHAVIAAETDGAPLQPALVRAGDEAHRRRRVRAEEAARRVPVTMLFPLVFCILPAFCLLTVVPLLAGSIAELRLPD